jgi:hypothetical protein
VCEDGTATNRSAVLTTAEDSGTSAALPTTPVKSARSATARPVAVPTTPAGIAAAAAAAAAARKEAKRVPTDDEESSKDDEADKDGEESKCSMKAAVQ